MLPSPATVQAGTEDQPDRRAGRCPQSLRRPRRGYYCGSAPRWGRSGGRGGGAVAENPPAPWESGGGGGRGQGRGGRRSEGRKEGGDRGAREGGGVRREGRRTGENPGVRWPAVGTLPSVPGARGWRGDRERGAAASAGRATRSVLRTCSPRTAALAGTSPRCAPIPTPEGRSGASNGRTPAARRNAAERRLGPAGSALPPRGEISCEAGVPGLP